MRVALGLLLMPLFMAATTDRYETQIAEWRRAYERDLLAPGSWVAVAGLFWLQAGTNSVGSDPGSAIRLPARAPAHLGTIDFHDGHAMLQSAVPVEVDGKRVTRTELRADTGKSPNQVGIGDLKLQLIQRGNRYGIRLWDPENASRKNFAGLKWYPVNESFRVTAKYAPYVPARKINVVNILGDRTQEPSPGYAEFTLDGNTLRLDAMVENEHELFWVFKDQTTGRETYGAGRFLKSPMPAGGKVDLDFNKAYNPPCAYTAFATCPLPPKQNALGIAIMAGEKKYGKH